MSPHMINMAALSQIISVEGGNIRVKIILRPVGIITNKKIEAVLEEFLISPTVGYKSEAD